jgi:chromosome segregation ATPase
MSDKNKSILGKVGSFFVEEVPDEKPQDGLPPPAQSTMQSSVPPFAPSVTSAVPVDPERAKQLDDAAMAQLSAAMEKVAGSYAEFSTDMEVLAEAVPDENLRLKAAVKMLGKKGVTVSKILSDVDACLGALESENRTFKAATQEQIDQRVGSKRKAVEQLKTDIAAKQAQITALQNDIAALQGKLGTAASEIKSEEDNITVVQDRFSYVFTNMRASLTAQRARIAQGT